MINILCIGEALIDMICTDKDVSLSNGENFLKKPGGAPTNVAAAISALGGEAYLSAKVGKDPFGDHLVAVMKAFNVRTDFIIQDANYFTTFAFVSLLANGERDFYFNRGADAQLSKEDISKIDLQQFPIVHFGSATGFLPGPLQETYDHLFEQAQANNCFISFDPNYRQLLFQNDQAFFIKKSWQYIEACNFFKVSDEEALLITGEKNIEDAASMFSKKSKAIFAITIGKEGTLLGIKGQTFKVESLPVDPVDTTGAGDAFVGAVLYLLSLKTPQELAAITNEEWQTIIAQSNKAGARTCEYLGAMEAFKHLNKNIFN